MSLPARRPHLIWASIPTAWCAVILAASVAIASPPEGPGALPGSAPQQQQIPVRMIGGQAVTDETLSGKLATATWTDEAPTLDGRVDEAIWDPATVISDFRQREPQEGGEPSERTEVRVLYDGDNLYLSFVLFDSNPGGVRATQLRRDSLRIGSFGASLVDNQRSDDTVAVILDTYLDGRNAFLFAVNALGTKFDATVRGESLVNTNWDERWEAAAQVTERGWEAELAIPWAILRYDTDSAVWGMDLRRDIRRKNEEVLWSNSSRDYEFIAVSRAGRLAGLENLRLKERFRIKPYVTGTWDSFERRAVPFEDTRADWGIEDFKIKLSSNLTSQFTYNTDFAQVEVDDQRVNLTRDALFFPEKREFFLEAANNFAFGPERREAFGPPVIRMYHSRNIGLDADGQALPIDYGAKVTGRIGGGNIGLLNVKTGDSAFGEGSNHSVLRWRQDVLERSSIGVIGINVEGPGGDFNRVYGTDANFQFGNFNFAGFAVQSEDGRSEGRSWAGRARADYNSDLVEVTGDVIRIEPDFRNDLGFILRRNVLFQRYDGQIKPRPAGIPWLRQVRFVGHHQTFHDLDGRLISQRNFFDVRSELESGDTFIFSFERKFERLDFPLRLHPDVAIPPGEYTFRGLFAGIFTNAARKVSLSTFIEVGEFYDGDRFSATPAVTIRFSENFTLRPELSYNKVDLPAGAFTSNIARMRAELSFSDRLLTDALAQYNSVSQEFEMFARLRYIYRIGDNVYLVYRQARRYDGGFVGPMDQSVVGKMTFAFGF